MMDRQRVCPSQLSNSGFWNILFIRLVHLGLGSHPRLRTFGRCQQLMPLSSTIRYD